MLFQLPLAGEEHSGITGLSFVLYSPGKASLSSSRTKKSQCKHYCLVAKALGVKAPQ